MPAHACYYLRPLAMRTIPVVSKYFGIGRVKAVLHIDHPSLPQDPADDGPFYRGLKAELGGRCYDAKRNAYARLVTNKGDGVWRIRHDFGGEVDTSGYDVLCGLRESSVFVHTGKVNSINAGDEFAFMWPDRVVSASVLGDAKHIPYWAEKRDASLTVRDLYAFGYQAMAAHAKKVAEYEKRHGPGSASAAPKAAADAAEAEPEEPKELPPTSPVNADGAIECAQVELVLAHNKVLVPLYVSPEDCERYGRSYLAAYGIRTPSLPTAFLMLMAVYMTFLFGADLVASVRHLTREPDAWTFDELFADAKPLKVDADGKRREGAKQAA
eukprot:TRINITY_DN30208_c0_g1_i1.p1 TRINITY_DN30208_c0_g1~~TRINITY_DN30208_c0_g1_i1.p1  ORF type:complete len:365 (+),score=97.88 TRINITY_DN30208_c0_g1_i1:120-1097(+)